MSEQLPQSELRVPWRKFMLTEDMRLLRRWHPKAFVLLTVIAERVQRTGGYNRHGLKPGEAFLGDCTEYGLSRKEYRTAIKHLQEGKFASFESSKRGTVARLLDTRVFDANVEQFDQENDRFRGAIRLGATSQNRAINGAINGAISKAAFQPVFTGLSAPLNGDRGHQEGQAEGHQGAIRLPKKGHNQECKEGEEGREEGDLLSAEPTPSLPDEVQLWNAEPKLPKVRCMSPSRLKKLSARRRDPFFRENVAAAIKRIATSEFCTGAKGWRADFDWLLQADSVLKVMEGKYDNRNGNSKPLSDGQRIAQRIALEKEIERVEQEVSELRYDLSFTQIEDRENKQSNLAALKEQLRAAKEKLKTTG